MKKSTLAFIMGLSLTGSYILAESLQEAAYTGFTEQVKALIKKGADVNKENEDGITPLVAAASTCRTDIVEILLDKEADPTKKVKGETAMEYAIKQSEFLESLKKDRKLRADEQAILNQCQATVNVLIDATD